MESFADELPKAELHLHLVGSASVLGLSHGQLTDLARNSVRASFLDAPAKQALIDEIDAVAGRSEGTESADA